LISVSITAEGLLRLKEYGARAAIFDIDLYTSTVLSSLKSGRIKMGDLDEESRKLSEFIRNEQRDLFTKAKRVARDNDLYLIQSSALFGRSWVSLNLREEALADKEQLSRRPMANPTRRNWPKFLIRRVSTMRTGNGKKR